MFRKKKNNEFDTYEEDIMNLASKEEEIMSTYGDDYIIVEDSNDEIDEIISEEYPDSDEVYAYPEEDNIYSESEENYENKEETYEDYNEYIEDEVEYSQIREKKYKKIINIIFAITMIVLSMITIDVISVARYDVGPFFALPLQKYKDGGSKAYYGFGYKVIKYKQLQGRRDKEIGFWSLKYNIEPITMEDIDLAIEMNGNETKTYKKYYKRFVRITSTLEKIDKKNNQITIGYTDEGKKYSLTMKCSMASKKSVLDDFKENEKITIIGTVHDFKHKTKNSPSRLYLTNCFAEQ